MQCISCKLPLRALASVSGIRARICDACKSVAVDLASLEAALPAARTAAIDRELGGAPTGDRHCPRCGLRMVRAPARGASGPIEIDGCLPCALVWLDPGELSGMRRPAPPPPGPGGRVATSRIARERDRRIEDLRRHLNVDADDISVAELIGLLLGIPMPEPVEGATTRPIATLGLCAVTAALSLVAFSDLDDAARRFGAIPNEIRHGQGLLGLVTSFFVHVDLFHLLGNLAFLFVFGAGLEALVGRLRFGAVVAAAAIAGGLAHAIGAPDPSIPLIGASGGISGVIAAHVCLRPGSRIRMLILLQVAPVPAWGFFVLWIVLQSIGAAAQLGGLSAVSALAHLGGAAVGLALGFAWRGLVPR